MYLAGSHSVAIASQDGSSLVGSGYDLLYLRSGCWTLYETPADRCDLPVLWVSVGGEWVVEIHLDDIEQAGFVAIVEDRLTGIERTVGGLSAQAYPCAIVEADTGYASTIVLVRVGQTQNAFTQEINS
jgi:hypothetical protein